MQFTLHAPYRPSGDQPDAIEQLVAGLKRDDRSQTLLGVTGSGKTYTMANVIAQVQRPTLIISHNKTLAAQLASEFREYFPKNAVSYFVSYYDYYQPEAYMPASDTYIEKETDINEEIDRLRHSATHNLLTRKDVLIVASVSCIYGLGSPSEYQASTVTVRTGATVPRQTLLHTFTKLAYQRNDADFRRGTYRVRGECIEVHPAYGDQAYRILLDGDRIERIQWIDPLTGEEHEQLDNLVLYPAKHFMSGSAKLPVIFKQIRQDLGVQVAKLKDAGKIVEAQRLEQRTKYDLEMLEQTGYANGIENYSRYFDSRAPGTPPYTLLDYFPKDFLLFIDESHITIPQIRGMVRGDRSRKAQLVDYGFRLPAAFDNRPLTFEEFDAKIRNRVYVSATPEEYERTTSAQIVEQLIRPTGLLDPTVEIRPTKHQIDDLVERVQARIAKQQRVLITTLTKRMAEDLAEYLKELTIKVQYLHADVDTMERLEILRDLRLGTYDVVVGINLLREGLDLPEVSLVVILDADKEGYLRSTTALIQTMGRAARHVDGHAIMYADRVTDSMRRAIEETERRRKIQEAYNRKHRITPQTILKAIRDDRLAGKRRAEEEATMDLPLKTVARGEIPEVIRELRLKMELAAKNLEFEKAAAFRDTIRELRTREQKAPKRRATR